MEKAYTNENYQEWFNKNIYNLAKKYAGKNPVTGIDREDYVQELVARVWMALPKYDPEKSSLSTFAYLWFGSKRNELIRGIIRANNGYGEIASLSEQTTESGCELADTIAEAEPDYDVVDARRAYESICVESRMFYEGYTVCQISHELGTPMATVKMAIDNDVERLRGEFGANMYN